MKPHEFVTSVIKQLEGFNVKSIDFELHVGFDGLVGTGDTILKFSVNASDYNAQQEKELNKAMSRMLRDEGEAEQGKQS